MRRKERIQFLLGGPCTIKLYPLGIRSSASFCYQKEMINIINLLSSNWTEVIAIELDKGDTGFFKLPSE
jgi:hypothetical protein